MSQFGSESDKSSVKSARIQEDFGDDVSILSRTEEVNWRVRLFKISLGLIFIGACTAAIVYSITKSETKTTESEPDEYLPFDRDQIGAGMLHFYSRDKNGKQMITPTFTAPVKWIQESGNQRLMYRVGNDSTYYYTVFALSNVGYNETSKGCTSVPGLTYQSFIDKMGLRYVERKTKEEVRIGNETEDVYIYEGEPDNNATYYGMKPSLIRAFSPISQSFMFGFEEFFDATTDLFKVEHWIPHMEYNDGSQGIIDMIPHSCTSP